jgi:hypothetical protein
MAERDAGAEHPRKRSCQTMQVHNRLLAVSPQYRAKRRATERQVAEHLRRERADGGLRTGVVTIPVVVHIVHRTAAENISDAQIHSQIEALNRDFRRLNPDVASVPAPFAPLAADARIEFRFAARDPRCQPTSGITRTRTSVTGFDSDDAVKFSASGGHDAWPADRYLNIWVANLDGGLLGYAQFPGGPSATDGVVIAHDAFGTIGTAAAPFDRGRTATHEIGHWLDLLHIWGDDGLGCSGSDNVADTPNQAGSNGGCPQFPHVSCSNGPNGDMFMNYMDYTDDACMFMFTAGQAARMDAALYGPRASLLGSNALVPPLSAAQPDLWMQDSAGDLGGEPNTLAAPMWLSEDIWVRRQDDGFQSVEHQNPEFRPAGGSPNFLYCRVRNRSCRGSGQGELHLYWAKASTAPAWPAPWDGSITSPALMGGKIGSQPTGRLAAGGYTILEFPWFPPDPADYASFGADRSHFCLLARIENSSTPPFGMTVPEGADLAANVRNNNNIAWKNLAVADELPGGARGGAVTIGNPDREPTRARLLFAVPEEESASLLDRGSVLVDLGERLLARWKDGGAVSEGFEPADGASLRMLDHRGVLGNLELEPGELHTITVAMEPGEHDRTALFLLDVVQSTDDEAKRLVGGQRFALKTTGQPARQAVDRPPLDFDGVEWVPRGD